MTEDSPAPTVGRDAFGRFLPGQAPKSPGRPRGSHRESFYRWAEKQFPDWLERAAELAKEDAGMLRFLIEQYMGKPTQGLEVEHLNEPPAVAAIRQLQETLKASRNGGRP
jgi:hypothetical protein